MIGPGGGRGGGEEGSKFVVTGPTNNYIHLIWLELWQVKLRLIRFHSIRHYRFLNSYCACASEREGVEFQQNLHVEEASERRQMMACS